MSTRHGSEHDPFAKEVPIIDMIQGARGIWVETWTDPHVDETGHDLRSAYVERFYLGVLGPSTTWLARLLVDRLDSDGDGYALDLGETALHLGLGRKVGRHSAFARSFERLVRFGVARPVGSRSLAVRRHLPLLNPGQVARLSAELRLAHAGWTATELRTSSARAGQNERAEGVALGLVAMGEAPDVVAGMLRRWGFGPTTSDRAARWAADRTRQEDAGPLAA